MFCRPKLSVCGLASLLISVAYFSPSQSLLIMDSACIMQQVSFFVKLFAVIVPYRSSLEYLDQPTEQADHAVVTADESSAV